MSRLTTHILDTAAGIPAAGVRIRLYREGEAAPLAEALSNADGRCDAPLLAGADFQPGQYRLEFDMADYFRRRGAALDDPPFVDRVVLCFGIADRARHYHVPLLVSPWSYSTYRGS